MKRALALAVVVLTASWLSAGAAAEPTSKPAAKAATKTSAKAADKASADKSAAASADQAKPADAKPDAGTATAAPAAVQTAAASTKPDPAAGKAIVDKVCAACHGPDGNSPLSAYPKLAGQFPEYIEKQLHNFKTGPSGKPERASPVMAGFAASLSDTDIRNLAAYFSGQTPKPGAAKNKDTVALGQKIWRGGDVARGLPSCAGCHGPAGAGLPVQFPRLAGQNAEYTEAQLRAFRTGDRANDANHAMRTIAAKLSDAEIKAVADYAAGLK